MLFTVWSPPLQLVPLLELTSIRTQLSSSRLFLSTNKNAWQKLEWSHMLQIYRTMIGSILKCPTG
eukprot:3456083-Karenia_brevis.AAC.1